MKLHFLLSTVINLVIQLFLNSASIAQVKTDVVTIPNAKLTIEFKGKTAYCRTNEKGEFAIYLPDTSKTFIEAKEYKAILTVDLPKEPAKLDMPNLKGNAINKTLNYMLKQSDAPYYEFTLFYDKSKNQLLIKPNTNIQQRESKIKAQEGVHREKGDPTKVGDKYEGEVAHF